MPSGPKQQYFFHLLLCTAIVTLLLFSALNIENYLAPKEVLGVEIEDPGNEQFWNDFLAQHPDYIPGWIELARWDKVRQIDPNYLLP